MNLLNFMSNFADEESCVTYLKKQRERRGVICKHCGCTEHRWDLTNVVSSVGTATAVSPYVQVLSCRTANFRSATGLPPCSC